MNINQTIASEIKSLDSLTVDFNVKYGVSKDDMGHFLLTPMQFEDRQKEAIIHIERIFGNHGKRDLIHHVVRLAKTEHGIRELEPWQRDHVVHALLCYILGIYLNEKYLSIKVDQFEWKIACLLHDIFYPAEFAHVLLSAVPDDINAIAKELSFPERHVSITTKIEGLEVLSKDLNGLDMIQNKITSWGLVIDVKKEYSEMQNNHPCHGMYSAMAVLNVIDMMYEKYNPLREYRDIQAAEPDVNWNQQYFEREILNACSAIFIHNLPLRCFASIKINRRLAPTAFLLKLCDSLQDWERPSKMNTVGKSANNYDIHIGPSSVEVVFNTSAKKKIKVRKEIEDSLQGNDIHIL